jgi:phosphate starvation-inducible PhoH-like protein
MGDHLRAIEVALAVTIRHRMGSFRVEGAPERAERAIGLLVRLYAQAERAIEDEALQLALVEARQGLEALPEPELRVDQGPPILRTRRSDLTGRTPNQVSYLNNILAHDISFGLGPAGTGKTFLAVACAVDALERSAVQRIVLTRPAVEAGERLGFLPGDLAQKVDPYLRPLYDALYDLMGLERVAKAFEKGLIEIAPLAFMRGRTLSHAFVILDEAQNTTPEQMKMFLTRVGFGSKAVVTGDTSQIDLPHNQPSGLVEAARILKDVRGVAITRFTVEDVVRHPLVARIVEAYEAAEAHSSPKTRTHHGSS